MQHTNDTYLVKFINGTYRDDEWGYAGMKVRIVKGFAGYILKSFGRGTIAMDESRANLVAFARANFWTVEG